MNILSAAKISAVLAITSVLAAGEAGAAPEGAVRAMNFSAEIKTDLIREGSALLKSKKYPDVVWTLNDSGGTPCLFAVTEQGKLIIPKGVEAKNYKGLLVTGAANVDWEALTADGDGNLLIIDAGNNNNKRKDLAVYIVPEPDPREVSETSETVKIDFSYPDQVSFPPVEKNYDCEAAFFSEGHLYLLTKHRSDTDTKLYRFDPLPPQGGQAALTLVGYTDIKIKKVKNEIKALKEQPATKKILEANPVFSSVFKNEDYMFMVTDAALSPDGKELAVLTYAGIWLFEKPEISDNFIGGKRKNYAFWPLMSAGQCEGITFSGENILVSNEEGRLFTVPLSAFE